MSKRPKVLVTDIQTGETVLIECDDPDQLMQAVRGTAKALDRAILNASKSPPSEHFIQMNQAKLKYTAKDSGLSGCDNRIWEYCLGDAGYGGKIQSTQVEISAALKITPSRVNRAFGRLKAGGMIEPAGADKGTPTFRVAEKYGIKGKRELSGTKNLADVIRIDRAREKLKRKIKQ